MTVNEYIENHSCGSDAVLDAVERWAHLHTAQPQMLCGSYEGSLLTMLCRLSAAKIAVEIGSFVGYSTICIARGLANGGLLHAFEVNEEYESVICRHLDSAGVGEKVKLHIGDAKQLFPDTFKEGSAKIDFAFIDADKRSCCTFYDMLVPMMRQGGLLLIDNMLWGGKVLDDNLYHDIDSCIIRQFNDYVQSDSRVQNILLPVRDGIMMCMVE